MPRRFNFTGRKKIRRDDAVIRLIRNAGSLYFDADLNLESYQLDPGARVFLEAYRSRTASWKRFDFGLAGDVRPPADRSLSDFQEPEGIRFRVKVTVGDRGAGKLLAEVDQLRPLAPEGSPDRSRSLLSVITQDLEGEVWALDFTDEPLLVIDEKLPQKQDYALDPVFRAHAAPAILREILTRICLIDPENYRDDDPDHWTCRWVKFGEMIAGQKCPDLEEAKTEDERGSWIDGAVRAFAKNQKLIDTLLPKGEPA